MKPTLPGGSTVRFPVGRVFIAADQHRVRSRCARDVLWLGTYHRCNAQLEFSTVSTRRCSFRLFLSGICQENSDICRFTLAARTGVEPVYQP
jgi:hypothetical protein